jgi:hypothetical protein
VLLSLFLYYAVTLLYTTTPGAEWPNLSPCRDSGEDRQPSHTSPPPPGMKMARQPVTDQRA